MLREVILRYHREFGREPTDPARYNRRFALQDYRGCSDEQCELLWDSLTPDISKIYNCLSLIEVTVCIKGLKLTGDRVNTEQEGVYLGQLLTAVYGGCIPTEFIPALVHRVRNLLEDCGSRCITEDPQEIKPLRVLGIVSYQDFASTELVTDMLTQTLRAAKSG